MTIIRTKDFILRPHELNDAKNIYEYQLDAETQKNCMSTPKSIAEAKKEIREKLQTKKERASFVIVVNQEVVGEIGLHHVIPKHSAMISYWIAAKCRGKGIITKAVKLITDYGFKKFKLVRIQGNVRTFNKSSARVLEKAGYKLEGILKKGSFKNGKYMDNMIWAKVK